MVQGLANRWAICALSLFLLTAEVKAQIGSVHAPLFPSPLNISSSRSTEDAAVERALDRFISVDFLEEPFARLVPFLRQYHLDAVFDLALLGDAGIGLDSPILKCRASQISLRSALRRMLDREDLAYVISNGKLLITTKDSALGRITVKVYPVNDLVSIKHRLGTVSLDPDTLIELLETTVIPQTWDQVGGPGTVNPYQSTLVIGQTQTGHEMIEQVLAGLRQGRAQQKNGKDFSPIDCESPPQLALCRKFARKLNTLGSFHFVETRLEEAVDQIARLYDLPILLDDRALQEAGVGGDTPITFTLRNVPPRAAMELLLKPLDLNFMIKDECIWITTKDRTDAELIVRIYLVGDLVVLPGQFSDGGPRQDFNSLIELITTTVRPQTWDEVGGPGSIATFPVASCLVVSQIREVHEEVARLLTGLRQLRTPIASFQAKTRPAPAPDPRGADVITKVYTLDPNLDPDWAMQEIRFLDGQTWRQPGGSIRVRGQLLTVRTTRKVHHQIAEWLRD